MNSKIKSVIFPWMFLLFVGNALATDPVDNMTYRSNTLGNLEILYLTKNVAITKIVARYGRSPAIEYQLITAHWGGIPDEVALTGDITDSVLLRSISAFYWYSESKIFAGEGANDKGKKIFLIFNANDMKVEFYKNESSLKKALNERKLKYSNLVTSELIFRHLVNAHLLKSSPIDY
jgi:hypothetical protein